MDDLRNLINQSHLEAATHLIKEQFIVCLFPLYHPYNISGLINSDDSIYDKVVILYYDQYFKIKFIRYKNEFISAIGYSQVDTLEELFPNFNNVEKSHKKVSFLEKIKNYFDLYRSS